MASANGCKAAKAAAQDCIVRVNTRLASGVLLGLFCGLAPGHCWRWCWKRCWRNSARCSASCPSQGEHSSCVWLGMVSAPCVWPRKLRLSAPDRGSRELGVPAGQKATVVMALGKSVPSGMRGGSPQSIHLVMSLSAANAEGCSACLSKSLLCGLPRLSQIEMVMPVGQIEKFRAGAGCQISASP